MEPLLWGVPKSELHAGPEARGGVLQVLAEAPDTSLKSVRASFHTGSSLVGTKQTPQTYELERRAAFVVQGSPPVHCKKRMDMELEIEYIDK